MRVFRALACAFVWRVCEFDQMLRFCNPYRLGHVIDSTHAIARLPVTGHSKYHNYHTPRSQHQQLHRTTSACATRIYDSMNIHHFMDENHNKRPSQNTPRKVGRSGGTDLAAVLQRLAHAYHKVVLSRRLRRPPALPPINRFRGPRNGGGTAAAAAAAAAGESFSLVIAPFRRCRSSFGWEKDA